MSTLLIEFLCWLFAAIAVTCAGGWIRSALENQALKDDAKELKEECAKYKDQVRKIKSKLNPPRMKRGES